MARIGPVSGHDVVAVRRQGGQARILLSPTTVGASAGFMGTLRFAPGEYMAEHTHPYSDEHLYVVSGELRVRVGETSVRLGPDDALLIPRDERHRLEHLGDVPTELVFFIGPLAPRPELGHVYHEALPHPELPAPRVGHVPAVSGPVASGPAVSGPAVSGPVSRDGGRG